MSKKIKFNSNYDKNLAIDYKIGINVEKPEHLLHLKCTCGEECYIEGDNWIVELGGTIRFKCQCGEIYSLNEKSPDVAVRIIQVLKDNNWEGGCDDVYLKKEINRVLNE